MQIFLKLFKVYWMWYNQHLLNTQVEQGFNFFSHVCWLYTLREVTYWLLCLNFTSVNSVQFSSVTQSCPTLCDPMNRSTPGLPVHHQLSESTQTHIHWVGDAIQPSHPLSSFSSRPQSFPASESFPMSQLFAWSIGVSASASVLPMNTQVLSPLGWTGWISLQSKGLSRVFSNTTVQKHQFFGAQIQLQLLKYVLRMKWETLELTLRYSSKHFKNRIHLIFATSLWCLHSTQWGPTRKEIR